MRDDDVKLKACEAGWKVGVGAGFKRGSCLKGVSSFKAGAAGTDERLRTTAVVGKA